MAHPNRQPSWWLSQRSQRVFIGMLWYITTTYLSVPFSLAWNRKCCHDEACNRFFRFSIAEAWPKGGFVMEIIFRLARVVSLTVHVPAFSV